MRYLNFKIQNYKGIDGPLVVDISKRNLVPMIGVNECGKTTILYAIFAFDYYNDDLNKGRHLKNIENLYKTSPDAPLVSTDIELNKEKLINILDSLIEEHSADSQIQKDLKSYKRVTKKEFKDILTLSRNLKTLEYSIEEPKIFKKLNINKILAEEIVGNMPFILYFDDFRDPIEEKVEIIKDENSKMGEWLSIIEQLFKKTKSDYSVFKLKEMDEKRRKGVLSDVKKTLDKTLIEQWERFRLDDKKALKISIEWKTETTKDGSGQIIEKDYIQLEIIDKTANDEERYFGIDDRSKGFYWFFNFVMKLEFNPKIRGGEEDRYTIYLLDEPGSYLHSRAQSKLCEKLRQLSNDNIVIYCTHSHYLLDPEIIPINNIQIVEKDDEGKIALVPIHESKSNITERRGAFQPIIDALEVKPFTLDISSKKIIIVEGIYDYYAYKLFSDNSKIDFLPSVNADSIKFYISLMIAWGVDYSVIWDNDIDGRQAKKKAGEYFGDIESKKFILLPYKSSRSQKTILQDLFEGKDLLLIRNELQIPKQTSFEKTIAELFFSKNREKIMYKISPDTKNRFKNVMSLLE
jgi:predicted ATP-dependent endonuclease of OLD family